MNNRSLLALALVGALGLSACGDGDDGAAGADGVNGLPGTPGENGLAAGAFVSSAEKASDLTLSLAPQDIVITGTEPFTVRFTAMGKNNKGEQVPFVGLDKVAFYVTTQSANSSESGAPYLWTNHATANGFASSMYCSPSADGKTPDRVGNIVDSCTIVEDEPGVYTGTWLLDGNAPVVLENGDPNDLHRVVIRAYDVVNAEGVGLSDKVMSAPLDFIPATGELALSQKDTVSSEACIQCHTALDGYDEEDPRFANVHKHHNYQKVEYCISCHTPDLAGGENDPEKGYNANFAPMIHTIHAGHHIADDLTGEAKDKFGEIGFPAELTECVVCHDKSDSWNETIYAEACVGCHVDVNFETGEGHSEFNLAQADDSNCASCHGAGDLSPEKAHKVGRRAELADKFTLNFLTAAVSDNGVDDGLSTLTITTRLTMNGGAPADDTVLADYIVNPSTGILVGNLDSRGTVSRLSELPLAEGTLLAGILTTTKDLDDTRLQGPIYVTSEARLCGANGKIITCDQREDDFGVANSAPVKYFNLTDPDATEVVARLDDPSRVTISTDKCNVCHENLTHVKGSYRGVSELTQCMDCHNETWSGTFHKLVEYKTDKLDEQGHPVFETVDGITFSNRDLSTVTHRFHTGLWDDNRGFPAVHLNADMEIEGYPAMATDCNACHIDSANLFADDGGLTSGKRAIKVSDTEYISPVAEACRSCHAHSDAAALAHFKSNGATVEGSPDTTAALPVESCATCHGEGKTYGVDKVHASSH